MVATSWIYSLRKEDLTSYLEEFRQTPTGTVEELRRQLAQYVAEHGDQHMLRLEVLAAKHTRSTSPTPPRNADDKISMLTTTYATVQAGVTNAMTTASTTFPNARLMETASVTNTWPITSASLTSHHNTTMDASLIEKVRKWSVRFNGDKGALAFIERLEELAAAYGIQQNHLPKVMSEVLHDKAIIWYRCNKRNWETWDHFKQDFLGFFLPPRYFEHLEDTIRQRLQLPREPFREYVIALQDLMHYANYNDTRKLERIYRNSRQDYQLHIKRHEFKTLADLIKLAGDYEEIKTCMAREDNKNRAPIERNRVVHTESQNIDIRRACRNCGQLGHFRRNCRNPRVLFCWECGKRDVRTISCCRRQAGNEAGAQSQGKLNSKE